jgi:NAD-dependent dihydropyrimidine dehydrogenase PreA subunit
MLGRPVIQSPRQDARTQQALQQFVSVDYDHCSYCGACVAVCPPDSITLHDATLLIDHDTCTRCRRCIPACPTGALSLSTEQVE